MTKNKATLLLAAYVGASSVVAQQTTWGQCGGMGYGGPTSCVSGATCSTLNPYYAQCVPATGIITSTVPATRTTSASPPPTPSGTGVARFAGINIAGFDFGCSTDGTCNVSGVYPPLKNFDGANNYPDGVGQMQHFIDDDNLNIFRLPCGWQYLVNSNLGGTLDANNLAVYDQLVQGCLGTGANCIIDIHNYARWNGKIIGQGGPTNAQFASLWTQLATKYASESRIWFGIMNEPHDLNVTTWAATVQTVVTAIRNAGATSQNILLPGSGYQSAGTVISDGSAAALAAVTNPDGSKTNLIFDVHKYLDSDNSGTNSICVTDNVANAFAPLATWLRSNNRKAILTETGGGNTASCEQYLCQQLQYINQNSDVYLGYVGWGAGSFDPGYPLAETPVQSGSTWTDQPLVRLCIAR
ncbi:glycoside hydrolase family 5 [Trichoderma arundinaceum]|uniref:Endoglucanase EG-II n=1 Tax=Trichoderma arundinaceum TaxID=490622 RepID=A0A395N942_TRIAR|nr:glycoside hydrolase family 5 [Trichoderma arundinaceum]